MARNHLPIIHKYIKKIILRNFKEIQIHQLVSSKNWMSRKDNKLAIHLINIIKKLQFYVVYVSEIGFERSVKKSSKNVYHIDTRMKECFIFFCKMCFGKYKCVQSMLHKVK